MGPRSSSPANMDGSVSSLFYLSLWIVPPPFSHFQAWELPPTYLLYIIALKQTQALDPHIKAETQAEVSTDSLEPVSPDVKVYANICCLGYIGVGNRMEAFASLTDYSLGLRVWFRILHNNR